MRVVHVVPQVAREASGPSYSVPRLCMSLAELGNAVTLSCTAAAGPIPGVTLDVHPASRLFGSFEFAWGQIGSLRRNARTANVVHNHSLWSGANVIAGWAVPARRAKLVVSPRGTLAPHALERSRWKKRLLWPLQRRVLLRADLLHATSEAEYRDIRTFGLTAPVAVIPNGIDLTELRERQPGPQRTLLFLGRIHPIKGIDLLLKAWQTLQDRHPDWRLVIVGSGEPPHEREVKELAQALKLQRVEFPGPLYGAGKSAAYRNAELFVLSSHTENFGMAVAEALAHGCPAIVSRGAPWSGLVANGCGWWIDNNVTTLTSALEAAMRLPSAQLREMGERGRSWMRREFDWTAIARSMLSAYRWIALGGEKPVCVHTS